jgi:hypothetical protein
MGLEKVFGLLLVYGTVACSGSDGPKGSDGTGGTGAGGSGGVGGGAARFVEFSEPDSDFVTTMVHDVDREVVQFDAAAQQIVWSSGTAVSGWTTTVNDLSWTGSGVAFSVRFGSEAGERRAYFTETLAGTICDLNITGPDMMTIYASSETPPQQ